jgi:hypothetical protein
MRAMHRFRKMHGFRRVVVTAIALLISNVAVISCAMAYALCAECPEHEPVVCIDACETTDVAIADKTSDVKYDVHRSAAFLDTGFSRQLVANPDTDVAIKRYRGCDGSSPPLHLQFCVFLK